MTTDPETVPTENEMTEAIAQELIAEQTVSHPVSHREVIETVISSLDPDQTAMVNHSEGGSLWKFQYGSVEVFVQMTGENDDDLLTVWAAVLPLPAKNEPELMRQLMVMNWESTFEACFGIFNDRIVVLSQRTVAGLGPQEISRTITLVAAIADENDERLQESYGQA